MIQLIVLAFVNLHNVTRNRISALNENPSTFSYDNQGNRMIGYDITLGKFEPGRLSSGSERSVASIDNSLGATDPSNNPSNIITERGPKKDGTADMRQKQRTIIGGSPKAKGAAGAVLAINAINFGLEFAGGMLVAHDIKLIKEQASGDALINAIGDLNEAISGGYIPDAYMNTESITDILNVVLQGESTTNNQDIMNIGIQILQNISGNYDEDRIKR